jgi:hypothetical protein
MKVGAFLLALLALAAGEPDAFFAQLRAPFSEREIVELTANIAHENYNAKFNRPLRWPPITSARYRLSATDGNPLAVDLS